MSPKDAAREDVQEGTWNPHQFTAVADRNAYGQSWDYFFKATSQKNVEDWKKHNKKFDSGK